MNGSVLDSLRRQTQLGAVATCNSSDPRCPGSESDREVAMTTVHDGKVHINEDKFFKLDEIQQIAVGCHEFGHVRALEESFGGMEPHPVVQSIFRQAGCEDGYDMRKTCDQEVVADMVCQSLILPDFQNQYKSIIDPNHTGKEMTLAYNCSNDIQTLVDSGTPLSDVCDGTSAYAKRCPHSFKHDH